VNAVYAPLNLIIGYKMCKHTVFFEKIIFKYHPEYQSIAIRKWARKNPTHFNIERLIEETIAHIGGYDFIDVAGKDFNDVDQSDAKTATIRATDRKFTIASVENKIGSLRIVLYNEVTAGVKFLYIPKGYVTMLSERCGSESQKYKIRGTWNQDNDHFNKLHVFRVSTFEELAGMSDATYADNLKKELQQLQLEYKQLLACVKK
jgi:hypothetical protein